MATLTGQRVKDSYKDLLQVSNSNSGIDSTLRTISDGEATDSVLQLSTTAVNISSAGALQYAGVAITSTQNAMLELMGGARMARDDDTSSPVFNEFEAFLQSGGTELPQLFEDQISGLSWRVAFDERRFGEGPWISGRLYEPYFSPKSRDMQYTPPDTPGDLSAP